MELSEQFGPHKVAFKHKGVVITERGMQKDIPQYSFEYRWNAPVGPARGVKIPKDAPREWATHTKQDSFPMVIREINNYLAQGYSVHKTGHLRAPGHPE